MSSNSHLVVIPTYNTGAERVVPVVRGAMDAWAPVWVVVDGSTDGSTDGGSTDGGRCSGTSGASRTASTSAGIRRHSGH